MAGVAGVAAAGSGPPAAAPPASSALPAGSKEVQNSPAFQFLDELQRSGRLSEQSAAAHKARYQQLHDVVLASYASESALLARAKELHQLLGEKSRLVEERSAAHLQAEEGLKRARSTSAAAQQELAELEDQRNMVRFEQEELERALGEKELILEDKRRRGLAEIEPQLAELRAKAAEAESETAAMAEAAQKEEKLAAELAQKRTQALEAARESERARGKKRQQLSQIMSEPDQRRAQVATLTRAVKYFQDEAAKLQSQVDAQERLLEKARGDRKAVDNQRIELGYQLEMLRSAVEKKEQAIDEYKKEIEANKDHAAHLLEERARINFEADEARAELQKEEQAIKLYSKEYDRNRRRLEKLRRKCELVHGVIEPLEQQIKDAEGELRLVESELAAQTRKLGELRDDEEIFISNFLQQEKVEEETMSVLTSIRQECKALEDKIAKLAKEEAGLHQQISELEASREMMARAASHATAQARETRDAVKVLDLILIDMEKQGHSTVARLQRSSKTYEVVKNQRNKFATLTQSSSQALAEMREKIKILSNEAEILRNESQLRDKVVAEESRQHLQARNARDACRAEQSKLQNQLRARKEEEMQQLLELEKLNGIINGKEREMLRLRRAYVAAVDSRNTCSILLIDRNDELSILYERSNLQERVMREGEMAIQKRAEEMRALELEVAELRRNIELARRKLPSQASYQAARTTLRELEAQLEGERKLVADMTKQLESPTIVKEDGAAAGESGEGKEAEHKGAAHSRILKGADPEPQYLAAKMQTLQERVNAKKEQLLEKELVLDEVSNLSDKLRRQVAESRGSMLDMAKKVNDSQARIRALTTQMMATVSELSMYQANALTLEEQRAAKERLAKEAAERLQRGLPPSEDAEQEWLRMERDRMLRREAALNRSRQLEELRSDVASPRSMAELRPNSYIPEDVPIPRPYGGKAPFKPTPAGANMRHIRKPQPVEIIL